jgi:hypothetical protein
MKTFWILLPWLMLSPLAGAHSASDAYLTLSQPTKSVAEGAILQGEWDIALRDLDFVLHLDDNGDGQITWGETKHHQAAIERYAANGLKFLDQTGVACEMKPSRFLIDRHPDGAYAALFFDVYCSKKAIALTLNYSLFFAIDPSHRGIFVLNAGDATSTALLSPKNARIPLPLTH